MRINEVASSLRAAYIDWDDVLVNPQFVRKGNTIAWPSFPPPFHSEPPLQSYVTDLEAQRQFTFQIIDDGSLVLISYHYAEDDTQLIRASLAYYGSSPPTTPEPQTDQDLSATPEPPRAAPSDPPIPWLRIDYSPSSARGPLHPICHMHLPQFPLGRIALTAVPSPRQFIEFILAICYPDRYKSHRLDAQDLPHDLQRCRDLNRPCFPAVPEPVHQILLHVRLP